MKHTKIKKISLQLVLVFSVTLLLSSCSSPKKIIYFQDIEGVTVNDSLLHFEPTIQVGDLLFINVSATDAEAAVPFNLFETPVIGNSLSSARPLTYLVDVDGNINFPVLGKLKVGGYTTKQLTNNLSVMLEDYVKDPIINIRLRNFKVSVVGEVNRPGTFTIENERISIIDAISLAGDLTIHGERKTILLIRETDGKKTFINLDITNKEVFNSPYFYLAQNDVLYVSPNKTIVNSSRIGPNTAIIVSSVSVLIALIAILQK